jgi:hypothetical protein
MHRKSPLPLSDDSDGQKDTGQDLTLFSRTEAPVPDSPAHAQNARRGPEAGAIERSETLVRHLGKLVDVILHHDFKRLRKKIHQVDRVDIG